MSDDNAEDDELYEVTIAALSQSLIEIKATQRDWLKQVCLMNILNKKINMIISLKQL